ncbi:DUF5103 domain-containing protein [Flavobacterium sp.]|uniref:type IX secretion system plug protein n=1 Tax=Flavobacterium sp. TaxID=239 RepID=UPI00352797DE
MKYCIYSFIVFLTFLSANSQVAIEKNPPYNIKTVAFFQKGNSVYPYFRLGESFELQFDDLFGNEADYYYTIQHYNYDWTPSGLAKVEFLKGIDNQRIMTYKNSYNTLQQYSHYTLSFPNRFNSITKSGNYIVTILDDDGEVVFTRKFIVYEDAINVGLSIRRARDFNVINEKQNMEIVINYGDNLLQDPKNNVNILLIQNGNLKTAIGNIKPQYTIGSELVYRYDSETQFWAGNEFYTLDTSNIRITNNSVAAVTAGDIYNSLLYTNLARKNKVYTYLPDFNGNFYVTNVGAVEDNEIEADYTWVYFSLSAPDFFSNNAIYVNGMFNNYALTNEYKLDYNKEKNVFEKAVLIKQGYTNYQYTIANNQNVIDFKNAIDGNFYQTENNYAVLVYYRGNAERYDRVIGRATNNSENIRN